MKLKYETPCLVELRSIYIGSGVEGGSNSCIVSDTEPTPEQCEVISLPDQR